MTDTLAFLNGNTDDSDLDAAATAADTEAAAHPAAPAAEPAASAPAKAEEPAEGPRVRGADGRFVSAPPADGSPAAAPATPAVAAIVAEPAPAAPQPVVVAPPQAEPLPLSALLDERDRRQKAEARAQELERQIAAQAPKTPAPDRYADPEGWERHQQQQLDDRFGQFTFQTSRRFAERAYGKEEADALGSWASERAKSDEQFAVQSLQSDDPYEFARATRDREKILATVTPSKLDAFLAWEAAQAAGGQPLAAPAASGAPPIIAAAPAPVPQPPVAPIPPRSLASATSAAGGAPTGGPGSAFDGLFRKA